MLNVANISKSYNAEYLFSGISFNVGVKDRIAVIGQNGTGKTTLFEIISGGVSPDSGSISIRKDTTIGYLRQDIKTTSKRKLLDEVTKSSSAINNLTHKIQLLQEELAEERDKENIDMLLRELGELQNEFESPEHHDHNHRDISIFMDDTGEYSFKEKYNIPHDNDFSNFHIIFEITFCNDIFFEVYIIEPPPCINPVLASISSVILLS